MLRDPPRVCFAMRPESGNALVNCGKRRCSATRARVCFAMRPE